MLHSSTIDRKTKADASAKTTEQLPEQDQALQLLGGLGQSRQAHPQQRENLAALQNAYGNQALLRMGRSLAANPAQGGILQRKCACGNSTGSSGSCAECQSKQEGVLQTKLQISELGDQYEQEADRIADQIMGVPELSLQKSVNPRKSLIQRKTTPISTSLNSDSPSPDTPPIVHEVLNSPGQPLDPTTRISMESSFGYDFSRVRVHTDPKAATSAKTVNALAYTVNPNIVFAAGKYAPLGPEGRRLLIHELAHVIQQSGGSNGVPRGSEAGIVLQRTPSCAHPTSCPYEFCREFPSREEAVSDRATNRDSLLSGLPVYDGGSSEVRALFGVFLDGGHALQDLSSRLARFFTRSSTTARSIRFLDRSLEEYFRSNPPSPGSSTTVNIQEAIPRAIAALGTPGDPNVMAFRNLTETPGLLAGGVGEGQVACPVGAIPSQVEDSRTATGTATGTNSSGTILVSSSIQFAVTDTLDFCPGNCGGSIAQDLTVPLSRYEATGISGDVPFTVTFSAPVGAFDSEE